MSSFNGFKEVTEKLDAIDFNPYKKIGKEWFLVTAGDESGWNTMTASWGFAGVMWGKNTFTTVIRPQRYTKEFIDKAEYFTISFFKEEYKKALSVLCQTYHTYCTPISYRKRLSILYIISYEIATP